MEKYNNSRSTFIAHFVTFVSQGITGVLFPFYKDITDNGTFKLNSKAECLDKLHDFNIVPLLLIDYINECWTKYNKDYNDKNNNNYDYDYVIVKLDKIKTAGNIKHNYCLFDLLWNFSFKVLVLVLARIDQSMMKDFETFKISINNMLDIVLEFSKKDLNNYEENCYEIIEEAKAIRPTDAFINIKFLVNSR